jgi:hypothetical protein
MTTSKPIGSPGAPDAYAPPPSTGKLEEDASLAALAVADGLRAGEVALLVFVGLLVCPPLAILVFSFVVPLLVLALVLGLLVAVLSTPYLLVHHFRGHHGGHFSLLAHRLRRAGRALVDLAPHRIVADARNVESDR